MAVCEGPSIMEFYCVTSHLLLLSEVAAVPHVCILIRLHSAYLLCVLY